MSKERTPDKVLVNPRRPDRDGKPRKLDQVKSFWHKARKDAPELWAKVSLKEFARLHAKVCERTTVEGEEPVTVDLLEACKRWLHNKAADTSNPPLGIGATRRKKGADGKRK